jgi:formylglycine-generating enzyme required for sulfatase activity
LPKDQQNKYRSYLADDKRFNSDDQPVVGISWSKAMAYCEWLTAQSAEGKAHGKRTFRLPTEIEWEWAATGGKRIYPWGDEKPDDTRANYGKKIDHPTLVGSYPAGATPEGLMDMAGNVWEWCLNKWKEPDFVLDEKQGLLKNWRSAKSDEPLALRGGAYYSDADGLRGSGRVVNLAFRYHDLGFRVCAAGES